MTDPIAIQAATEVITSATTLTAAIQAFIVQLLTSIGIVLTTGISFAAIAARFMPPPDQPGFMSKLHKFINAAGQNAGHAANADPKKEGE